MIIGIVTFGANRQKKLLRRFSDAALPEVGAAQRVGRFRIVRLEPLRCPPMFDGCFRLPVFPEKCGKGALRRDRLRIVPDELVVDLLHTQTLFCRYVGIRERLRCPMGRFDFYPRFYRRTDGLRTREHRRKEQNEERGGRPLAFTPTAPPAVADYHSCRSSWRDHLHMQKIGFAEASTQLSPPTTVIHGRLTSFFGTRLIIPQNSKRKPRAPPARRQGRLGSLQLLVANDMPSHSCAPLFSSGTNHCGRGTSAIW